MSVLMDGELESLLREDLPHFDLTTLYLGISEERGTARLVARSKGVLAGVEEAAAVYEKVGASAECLMRSGLEVVEGSVVLEARGGAGALHAAWRVAQALVSYMSGVATYTRLMVEAARRVNPRVVVATTRQTPPGFRRLWLKAVLAGGGVVHRQSLSDEILLFRNHLVFAGGRGLGEVVRSLKARVGYKRVGVEVGSLEEAFEAVEAGADYVQFDHVDPATLRSWVSRLRSEFSAVSIGVGGGVDLENVGDYAATGVDVIVTSAPYHAKPLDFTTLFSRQP
ncbi:ModD protein [Thermogladius sp. KZ2Tp1]|uniref:ModD protein n=1 Tax=Thermogladius sp. KZ2Tp1 TaxID=3136289 RepID=UPI003DAA24C4